MRVALREEHRPGEARRVDRERPRVDDARAGHRVDAEAVPREIGERETGHDLDVDAAPRATARPCAPRPTGCPGTAYTTSPCSCASSTTRAAIAAYTVSRSSPRVVEQVERLERDALGRELVDRGMARGAHVPDRHVARAPRARWEAEDRRRPDPRPTTTTRGALTPAARRPRPVRWSSSCSRGCYAARERRAGRR